MKVSSIAADAADVVAEPTADCGTARGLSDAAAVLGMGAVVVIAAMVLFKVGLRVLLVE